MDTLLPPVTLPRQPLIHPSSNAAAAAAAPTCHPTSSSLIHDTIIRTTTTNSHPPPPASFLDHTWDENHIILDEESFFGDCSSLNDDLMCIGDIGDTVQASWLDIVDAASSGNCINNKKEIVPLAPLNKPTTTTAAAVRRERKVPRKSANFMSEKNVLKDRGKCTQFIIKTPAGVTGSRI